MRLLVDVNLTPRWVAHLSAGGHQAVHWSSLGSLTASDREICDYARHHGFILLTNDLDFPQMLAHTREAAPSIIGESIRPAIWPTPIMNEGDDLAFDILAVASPDSGSDLTVVIQT